MALKETQPKVNRRKFLAGVAMAGAAGAVTPPNGVADAATPPAATPNDGFIRRPSALRPSAVVAAAETGTPKELARATRPDGSDFMVDVIKTLDIEYCPSNGPRASAACTSR
jgi:acetolactate synthase-1/2/3 large subunit